MQLNAYWGCNIASVDAIKHTKIGTMPVHVQGRIEQILGTGGFLLVDDTGKIDVHFTNQALKKLHFMPGMLVEVQGKPLHDNHIWTLETTSIKLIRAV
ncbi:MAG: hypothetical protein LLF94_07930 [Chlamydiales bacterium]|nr:hypothetical protein [Chlamydiales bacterium]